MPLITKIKVARLEQDCGAEDAEALLEWLLGNPTAKINLKYCTHMHAAIVQVLLAARPSISHWPDNEALANLLEATRLPTFNNDPR